MPYYTTSKSMILDVLRTNTNAVVFRNKSLPWILVWREANLLITLITIIICFFFSYIDMMDGSIDE